MFFLIVIVLAVIAIIWWVNGERAISLNERLYLKRRGYEPPSEVEAGAPVPKDAHLFSLIESLSDISPFARQRAAEDLSRMCVEGNRDSRMLSSLVATLDDSDPAVRSAVAIALTNLGDRASGEPLRRRLELEESIHVRASLERALEKLDE
jgi:hypothetical protein